MVYTCTWFSGDYIILFLVSFQHIENFSFERVAFASDNTPGYKSKSDLNFLDKFDLQVPRSLLSTLFTMISQIFGSLLALSLILLRNMVALNCSFQFERCKEDLPNSAIFKLRCGSKYFGSFCKRRLKDTEPKRLWLKLS